MDGERSSLTNKPYLFKRFAEITRRDNLCLKHLKAHLCIYDNYKPKYDSTFRLVIDNASCSRCTDLALQAYYKKLSEERQPTND